MTPEALVTEGAAIKDRQAADKIRLAEIETELKDLGAGNYQDSAGRTAQVIQPKDGVKPGEEDVTAARELIGDDEAFKKLFERVVSYKAVKSFGDVAKALLTAGKCKKLLALVTKPASAYVKWS